MFVKLFDTCILGMMVWIAVLFDETVLMLMSEEDSDSAASVDDGGRDLKPRPHTPMHFLNS